MTDPTELELRILRAIVADTVRDPDAMKLYVAGLLEDGLLMDRITHGVSFEWPNGRRIDPDDVSPHQP